MYQKGTNTEIGWLIFIELDHWGNQPTFNLSTYLCPVSWAMWKAVCKPISRFTVPGVLLQTELKLATAETNKTLSLQLLLFEFNRTLPLSTIPLNTEILMLLNSKKYKRSLKYSCFSKKKKVTLIKLYSLNYNFLFNFLRSILTNQKIAIKFDRENNIASLTNIARSD